MRRWVCDICYRPIASGNHYCDRCRRLFRTHVENAKRRKAAAAAYDKGADAFRCHYTGAVLEERDQGDPFYFSFDHAIPDRSSGLVMSSMLFNVLKDEFSPVEFPKVMAELAAHRRGKEFDRDVVGFEHWTGRLSQRPPSREDRYPADATECIVCGGPPLHHSWYCKRCLRLRSRYRFKKAPLVRALKRAWYPDRKGFFCHLTDARLEVEDESSPWYVTIDHLVPGGGSRLVVTAAWVNAMKSDLTEGDFWAVVEEYDRWRREGGEFDKRCAEFRHWRGGRKRRRMRSG